MATPPLLDPAQVKEKAEKMVAALVRHALTGDKYNHFCACGEYNDTVEDWARHALVYVLEAQMK